MNREQYLLGTYPGLTLEDMIKLTDWKRRYVLEGTGWTKQEAARLVFWRWLATVRLAGNT